MINLIYKEFKLSVHPMYLIFPIVLGGLMMIPQWIFFLVPLYFCFISVPNLLSQYKANNDLSFSAMLPVDKNSVVKARVITFAILELLHVFWAVIFAIIRKKVYQYPNFAFDTNLAYFGLIILMFGIFNLVLFPIYFKTAYKFGPAVIFSTIAAIVFAGIAEVLVMIVPKVTYWMEVDTTIQLLTFISGIILFLAFTWLSSRISVKYYKKIDL